jgi:hypothetical protein
MPASTSTEEAPKSLAPDRRVPVPRRYARDTLEHYAFLFVGINTGLRPSSLRPLRRDGANADIKWREGILAVRRSHTMVVSL